MSNELAKKIARGLVGGKGETVRNTGFLKIPEALNTGSLVSFCLQNTGIDTKIPGHEQQQFIIMLGGS